MNSLLLLSSIIILNPVQHEQQNVNFPKNTSASYSYAGKYFFDFEIPREFTALWRYMAQMYALDAFTQSCPADQDIINHYKQQMHVKLSRHEELEAPTFTNSLPPASCESKFE